LTTRDHRVINISATAPRDQIRPSLDIFHAAKAAVRAGVLIVAAANQAGQIECSTLAAVNGVIPVAGCNNLGFSAGGPLASPLVGKRGVLAPSEKIQGVSSKGGVIVRGGTSVAVAFVSGTIALLLAEFPFAPAQIVARSLLATPLRRTVISPLLNAD